MKTLTLQGTQKQFEKLYRSTTLEDKDNKLIPYEVETRAYVLDTADFREKSEHWSDIKDHEFQLLAEEQGRVYTLQGFQDAFNSEEINSAIDIIRFINVKV